MGEIGCIFFGVHLIETNRERENILFKGLKEKLEFIYEVVFAVGCLILGAIFFIGLYGFIIFNYSKYNEFVQTIFALIIFAGIYYIIVGVRFVFKNYRGMREKRAERRRKKENEKRVLESREFNDESTDNTDEINREDRIRARNGIGITKKKSRGQIFIIAFLAVNALAIFLGIFLLMSP